MLTGVLCTRWSVGATTTPATASTWQPSRSSPLGPPRCGTSRSWSRATRSEMLISCDRCPALGYADAEDHVIGGSLLDTGCPNEEEPRVTPLSIVWARSP